MATLSGLPLHPHENEKDATMKELKTLTEVAQKLSDGGPYRPDDHFDTVQQLVESLVNLGNTPAVFDWHDDHLGLMSRLSDEFLALPVIIADDSGLDDQIQAVLEEANTIIKLAEGDEEE